MTNRIILAATAAALALTAPAAHAVEDPNLRPGWGTATSIEDPNLRALEATMALRGADNFVRPGLGRLTATTATSDVIIILPPKG